MRRAGPAQGAVQDPEIACLGWNRPQETFRRPRQPEQAQQTSDTPKRFIGPVLREGSTKHLGRLDHITLEGQLKQQSGRENGQEGRSEEHTSELQSLMRISYAVFCLKKKKKKNTRGENMKKITVKQSEQSEHYQP